MFKDLKRAQISIFVIIGAIFILVSTLFIMNQMENDFDDSLGESDVALVKGYIESCIERSYESAIRNVAFNGGSFIEFEDDVFEYDDIGFSSDYPFRIYLLNNYTNIPDSKFIEDNIENGTEFYFEKCIDLSNLYVLEYDNIDFRVDMGEESNLVKLTSQIKYNSSSRITTLKNIDYEVSNEKFVKYVRVAKELTLNSVSVDGSLCLTCIGSLMDENSMNYVSKKSFFDNDTIIFTYLISDSQSKRDEPKYYGFKHIYFRTNG